MTNDTTDTTDTTPPEEAPAAALPGYWWGRLAPYEIPTPDGRILTAPIRAEGVPHRPFPLPLTWAPSQADVEDGVARQVATVGDIGDLWTEEWEGRLWICGAGRLDSENPGPFRDPLAAAWRLRSYGAALGLGVALGDATIQETPRDAEPGTPFHLMDTTLRMTNFRVEGAAVVTFPAWPGTTMTLLARPYTRADRPVDTAAQLARRRIQILDAFLEHHQADRVLAWMEERAELLGLVAPETDEPGPSLADMLSASQERITELEGYLAIYQATPGGVTPTAVPVVEMWWRELAWRRQELDALTGPGSQVDSRRVALARRRIKALDELAADPAQDAYAQWSQEQVDLWRQERNQHVAFLAERGLARGDAPGTDEPGPAVAEPGPDANG